MKRKTPVRPSRAIVHVVNPAAYRQAHPKFPGAAGSHQFAPDKLPQSFNGAPVVDQTKNPQQPWRDLPAPTGQAPYHLDLGQVLDAATLGRIASSGTLIFHAVGDTGGVNTVTYQDNVASYMARDFLAGDPVNSPSFFYHLGDVVYYDGEGANYYAEFYEPYMDYHGPIFAIPGNHDGDVNPSTRESSCEAFVRNFCAQAAVISSDNHDSPRTTMTQPNVYWTLTTPLATFVGMYSNCPEGGQIAPAQAQWLAGELAAAAKNSALILAVHHPVYSAYGPKPGKQHLLSVIQQACASAKRSPDVILTGHVHNYQRFSAPVMAAKSIPVIVAGAGGYNKQLHTLSSAFHAQKPPIAIAGQPGAVLENFNDQQHGYLKVTITAKPRQVLCEYFAVPEPSAPVTTPLARFDAVAVPY
ncbi:MAG: metallophosphoesterase [Candidatus Eremiobacteraeota bacterium]|nr:metallophosphoesterase [Candidatus Eremiobacteraeota bacterium]